MNKNTLATFIDKYRSAENDVQSLNTVYGINLFNSDKENFYNKYNYIIHLLLRELYDEHKAQLLEEFTFDQLNLNFNELYDKLKDGTNEKQKSEHQLLS